MSMLVRMGVFMCVAGMAMSVAYGCVAMPPEDRQPSGGEASLSGVLPMRIPVPEDANKPDLDAMQGRFRAVCAYLNAHPAAQLAVAGHTDDRGTSEVNFALSLGYASAVAKALVEQSCAASQIQTMGFGKEAPAVSGRTPEARAKNRRVVIELIREN